MRHWLSVFSKKMWFRWHLNPYACSFKESSEKGQPDRAEKPARYPLGCRGSWYQCFGGGGGIRECRAMHTANAYNPRVAYQRGYIQWYCDISQPSPPQFFGMLIRQCSTGGYLVDWVVCWRKMWDRMASFKISSEHWDSYGTYRCMCHVHQPQAKYPKATCMRTTMRIHLIFTY